MKIAPYLISIALLFTSQGKAQNFIGGALLGLNASQVSGDNLTGYNKAGLYGGFFVGKNLSEKSQLEMRLTYSAKGSRDIPDPENGKFSAYYLHLNYIEVPILYRYKIKKVWLFGGLSGGYLMHSSIANESGPFPTYSIENRPFKKYEVSTHLGISLALAKKWEIEVKTVDTFPLLPIRKHASGATFFYALNYGQTNNLLSFSLKYSI